MDMVPPITTAFFPYRRLAPMASAFEDSFDEAMGDNTEDAVSLRPVMPLAGPNVAMMLEILSEAGPAVNSNYSMSKALSAKGRFGRRDEDYRFGQEGRSQYTFEFVE